MPPLDWTEIERAFCEGMPLNAICSKFNVRLVELFAKAKAGSWVRSEPRGGAVPPGAGAPQTPHADEPPRSLLPVVLDHATEQIVAEAVDEAVADVINAHKAIARDLRSSFQRQKREYDAMCQFFASFADAAHIETLKAKDDGGESLRAYLRQALTHFRQSVDAEGRLMQTGRQLVELERTVWGLDRDADVTTELVTYDDLLTQIQRPLAPRELPKNIVQFEQMLERRRKKEGSGTP